ncbi:MAG: hypothetical protein C4520_11605 [Candidatus Abyssobacteria bacterium SURF_5]|uniref:Cytochrome c-552/4 domain-containing protein n=1 Tax=Abyssobacteria bacterium (strain SURF_5) TaxID=2093360 RepID=A0A3A4NXL2_ABYX5|nr:MAG: hypothetical protein C4520_11605 [Candidatus Abyssubacteria bacterium SURF_5]
MSARCVRKIGIVIICCVIVGAFSGSYAQMRLTPEPEGPVQFQSSRTCAKCHLDIHRIWKESLHARALEDNIFQSAFMMAIKQEGDQVRSVCLGCHAPTTLITGDMLIEQSITSEAITCDFCHRLSNIHPAAGPVAITSGEEKYGPLPSQELADSHPTVYSETFKKSDFCATCHQWTNRHGIAILDTYREWSQGPHPAKGVHCQDCHMPLVKGAVAAGAEKGGMINSHDLAGGHSITQVASAAEVKVVSVTRVASGIRAVVEVSNVGSGHMVPTGMPSRALALEVDLLDAKGAVVERQEYVFKKTVLDSEYNELTSDADLILNGAIITKDNRIPPGGSISIPFDFAAAPKKSYSVSAHLRYRYNPLILQEEQISIDMGADVKSL